MIRSGPLTLQGTSPQGDMAVAARPSAVSPRSDSCALRASSVETVSGLKVPPAFPWHERHARHCLPAALRLLSWVPWASVPHASEQRFPPAPRYCALLRLPSSIPVGSLVASLPVPWVDALSFVSLPACARVGSSAGRVGHQTPGCCLRRSPLLRPLLPRRREALPSSRFTRLNPCPALRPRWCPVRLPWRAQDCCLPALDTVGFGSGCPDLSLDHNYTFFGAQ